MNKIFNHYLLLTSSKIHPKSYRKLKIDRAIHGDYTIDKSYELTTINHVTRISKVQIPIGSCIFFKLIRELPSKGNLFYCCRFLISNGK